MVNGEKKISENLFRFPNLTELKNHRKRKCAAFLRKLEKKIPN